MPAEALLAAPLLMPWWMLGATCTSAAAWWLYHRTPWPARAAKREALARIFKESTP